MSKLNAWTLDDHQASISKAWVFDSFKTARDFFSKLADLAELHDHHPEVLSSHANMRIRLWTHDAGGLTVKDFELAMDIDQLIANDFSQRLKK